MSRASMPRRKSLRELPHSSVDPVSRSSAWSMKRGQTGSSSPSSSSSSSSSSIDARRIDPREGQTSRARWLLVSSTPPSDSAAFIHELGRLPGTGALFRVPEPAGRKKGVTRSRVVGRDGRRDGRRNEKRNCTRGRRNVLEERVTDRGREGRSGARSSIYSRGTREINGSRNR